MEDILLISIIGVVLLGTAIVSRWALKKMSDRQEKEIEAKKAELDSRYLAQRNLRAQSLGIATLNTPPKKRTFVKREEAAPTYAPSATESVRTYRDDSFMSDVATMVVVNKLMNSNRDSISGTVTEDRTTGKVDVKVNDSWGLDDSDSRRSSSSSFSSSDSSSSWSDSSSSSDSGPSSDW